MFTEKDLKQIEQRGSSLTQVKEQMEHFKKGFPWMKILAPATPDKGICVLDDEQADAAVKYYQSAATDGKCKFVPASGAASRMFKDMFKGLDTLNSGIDIAPDSPAARLVAQVDKFAFYDDKVFPKAEDSAQYRRCVLGKLLTDEGLNYGAKPKGVLKFHKYADGEIRTALAEHLVEAQAYMRNEDGTANLCVTISPEHRGLFEKAVAEIKDEYEKRYGIKYNITFTYQDKATDTIAVDIENRPFRTEEDSLLFRPAGHGALIYNLNNIKEELVSIKNIDNVAVERLLPVTAKYKQVLMGKALELRDKIFGYLHELDAATGEDYINTIHIEPVIPGYTATYDERYMTAEVQSLCDEIESFLDNELCVKIPKTGGCKERVESIRKKLNRPIRVCGMVKNEGEPGGGPFVIEHKDGSTSLQILESAQINMSDETARKALSSATHFNPVDIVCCLHNYKGESFDLTKYVDEDTGFISSKSYQGRELKALELPGLWNGAMSDWNTMFVEVPLDTFNPTKVVLDLLRPAHRN